MPYRILLRVGLPLPSKRWLLTRAAREVGVAVALRAGPVRVGKLGSLDYKPDIWLASSRERAKLRGYWLSITPLQYAWQNIAA